MSPLTLPQWRNVQCECLQPTQVATRGAIRDVVSLGIEPINNGGNSGHTFQSCTYISFFLNHLLVVFVHNVICILVSTVRLLHCSSTPPCFLPESVYGVSNTKRLMLWFFSKSLFVSGASFSSKYGFTKVTWT